MVISLQNKNHHRKGTSNFCLCSFYENKIHASHQQASFTRTSYRENTGNKKTSPIWLERWAGGINNLL